MSQHSQNNNTNSGTITLPKEKEFVMPGDNTTLQVELFDEIPLEPGLRYSMREGGRTVGRGVVSKILGNTKAVVKDPKKK